MSAAPEGPAEPGCRLPDYDEATTLLLLECFHGLSTAQDPVLGMLSHVQADALPSAGVPAGVTQGAFRGFEMEMRFVLPTRAVLACDVEGWASAVQDSVDQALPVLMRKFFGGLDEILQEAGQVVGTGGEPLSVAWMLKALEKVELDFDEDGNAKMPTLVVHPDAFKRLAENPPTPEEEKQLEALIEKKRQEFYARRRVRKLD